MRLTRLSLRPAAVIVAAGGLLVSLFVAAPAAQAASPALTIDLSIAQGIDEAGAASALVERLGARAAGSYFDPVRGEMVVAVTDASAARQVRAAGVQARLVSRGSVDLARVTKALDASVEAAGTAWSVDPATNQVVVAVDSTVTGAEIAEVKEVVRRYAGAVRVERVSGRFEMALSGGDPIYGGGFRCSLGFNVRSGSGQEYFLTAGHCTDSAFFWYANASQSTFVGRTVVSSFPGNDYGIVRYDGNVSRPGNVDLYNGGTRDITGAADPFIGQSVSRSGSTTGLHGGTVTGLNWTVNYPQGTVRGLIRTNVCAEPGDSGGALFAGNTALGLTSGGNGNCSFGGTTFFQPVTEPLDRFGLSVY